MDIDDLIFGDYNPGQRRTALSENKRERERKET